MAQCCGNVYIDCNAASGYGLAGNCDATFGFFAGDDNGAPYVYFGGTGACYFCELGCVNCLGFRVSAAGDCCGQIQQWQSNMCCCDPACLCVCT